MKIKSLALLGALTLSIIPMTVFADTVIVNNSDSPATALAGNSPCSSQAPGGQGIIQPNGKPLAIKDWVVGIYCSKDCVAQLFMHKNCGGKPAVTCTVNKNDGVKKCESHDKRADGYRIEGFPGKNIRIEGKAAPTTWFQRLFS